jgi:RecJ-like exonuclease
MRGIVTSVKLAPNPSENVYSIIGERVLTTKSNLVLEVLDDVEMEDGRANIVGKASAREYGEALKSIAFKKNAPRKSGIAELDSITEKMAAAMNSAADLLARRCLSGAPVVIRFHNDCDGSSGAVALYDALEKLRSAHGVEAFNIAWRMNKSIAYTADSFHSDSAFFNSFSSAERPVVVVIDFGTSQESEEAIGLGSERNDFVWLDHHPVYLDFPRDAITNYVNPWDFGSDSDYTAGFLACTFAEILSGSGFAALKKASLVGDYSKYAERGGDAHKLAIVLDYLTSKKGADANVTPKQIKQVVDDEQKLDETFSRASALLGDAIDQGVKKARKYTTGDGVKIFVLKFDSLVRENEDYPIMGRYSSWLQSRLESIEGEDVATFVYHGNYISVRAHRKVVDKLNLGKKLEQLKNASEYIRSFGGHEAAFSIKVDRERQEHVIAMILGELGAA